MGFDDRGNCDVSISFIVGDFNRSRRRFVQGLAGGALAVVGARHFGWAAADPHASDAGAVLSGTEFNLEIGALP